MSAEKKIEDNTSKEVLSDKSKTVQGDIYVQDVHKYFGVTKALNGVNFNANFGEIHAIVGGNGCGKSTLAKTMSGVLPVDKGKVSILGQTPTSPVMARNMGIATVFQEVMIAEESSVVDNLFVGSDDFWYKNLTQREKVLKAQEIMEDLVGEYVDPYTQAFNLSLPIKAWITIARAFLRENTKLLILDESSAALDFDSTERLFKKMRELRDRGVAIFIVTHRIAELVRISDKATVMRDGKDVGVLEKKDLNEKNLIGLMTGREETGEKSISVVMQTKTDKVVMRAENLVVWPDSKPVNFEVKKGEYIQVLDVQGRECSDFQAFSLRALDRGLERDIDPTTTRSLMGSLYPTPGIFSKYWTSDQEALIEIVQDTCGRHDTFGLACTARYYEDLGYPGHVNCSDNMNIDLAKFNIKPRGGWPCLLYTSPSPRDLSTSRMPSSA